MGNRRRFTITAALPYANGPLHIGHIAGAYLSSDIYARFRRLQDHDVFFVCGSDEHGAAITMRAKKEGRGRLALRFYHAFTIVSTRALSIASEQRAG